jgi:ATP-dependent RNA helicase DDX51/DBP6
VKRVLPQWLANPSVVSCDLKDDKAPIDSFSLDPHIVQILKQNCIQYFFPVQQQVIPWLISGNSPKLYRLSDICVSAPTGSGKTLSYALPIIQVLKVSRIYPCVRAIIVLPTEVLATQVFSVFKTYLAGSGLCIFLMTKRLTFSAERDALVKTGK